MTASNSPQPTQKEQTPFDLLEPKTCHFYLRGLDILDTLNIPFAVGGAYALAYHTGIVRHTKDLDIFVKRSEAPLVLSGFERAGLRTAWTHPHWIAKGFSADDEDFIDIIYGSGNGLTAVDDEWLAYCVDGQVLDRKVKICPAEEIIWSKSFIQERDRFDGADVAHMLRARAEQLDWDRLLRRFVGHEPVLLSHLLLFGYIYPMEQNRIPARVIDALMQKSRAPEPVNEKLCRGTFLSFSQYLKDVNGWGYLDARLQPRGPLTAEQIDRWTRTPK